MSFPVYQCEEWQCRYVFPDQRCCVRPKGHADDHHPADLLPSNLRQRARFLREALPYAMDFGDDRIINESSVTAIAALLDEAAERLSRSPGEPPVGIAEIQSSESGKAMTGAQNSLSPVSPRLGRGQEEEKTDDPRSHQQ